MHSHDYTHSNRLNELNLKTWSRIQKKNPRKKFQACFDKTGTLTEDGLDFYALRVVENAKIGENIVQIAQNETCQNVVRAIATCHTLSK